MTKRRGREGISLPSRGYAAVFSASTQPELGMVDRVKRQAMDRHANRKENPSSRVKVISWRDSMRAAAQPRAQGD
jgi:hypothetical protein